VAHQEYNITCLKYGIVFYFGEDADSFVTVPKHSGINSTLDNEPTLISIILLGSVLVNSAPLLSTHASVST
jgi:hypothetical protein